MLRLRHVAVAVGLSALLFASCATVQEPPSVSAPNVEVPPIAVAKVKSLPLPPVERPREKVRPTLFDKVTQADAVYLTDVEYADENVRYKIIEVWRHEPALGESPEIGSYWTAMPHGSGEVRGDQGVVIVKAHSRGHSASIIPVTKGRLTNEPTALSSLRTWVAEPRRTAAVRGATEPAVTRSGRPIPRPLQIQEATANAAEVYLLRVDTTSGQERFYVNEVWRRSAEEPLAVGAEVNNGPTQPVRPGIRYAQEAVYFRYPRPPYGTSGHFVGAYLVNVIHGLAGGLPLEEVRKRVMATAAVEAEN